MQDDVNDDMVEAMITSAEDFRRANRFPVDHQVLSIVPDWLDARLTDRERALLAAHHVVVRSHTEEYGPEGDS